MSASGRTANRAVYAVHSNDRAKAEEANMTGGNLICIGGDAACFPRLDAYRLSTTESQLLADGLRQYQVFTDGQFPRDVARQSLLAQIAGEKLLANAAPGLGRLMKNAREDLVDCIYVTNLPTERSITSLLLLTLSSAIGKIFNYGSQHGGELSMEVSTSGQDKAADQRAEFDWHTEDAWVPRNCRAEWICLLVSTTPPGSIPLMRPSPQSSRG
jgi:hypothetical protein